MNIRDRTAACAALVMSTALAALSGCAGYVPGAKAYWDEKVKEMCKTDGGVTILEKLQVSQSDIDLLGRVGTEIGIPAKQLANPRAAAYEVVKTTYLNSGNPKVTRVEGTVMRRADERVIARWILYARTGGDFPTGMSEGSAFVCPTFKSIRSDLQPMFVVVRGIK